MPVYTACLFQFNMSQNFLIFPMAFYYSSLGRTYLFSGCGVPQPFDFKPIKRRKRIQSGPNGSFAEKNSETCVINSFSPSDLFDLYTGASVITCKSWKLRCEWKLADVPVVESVSVGFRCWPLWSQTNVRAPEEARLSNRFKHCNQWWLLNRFMSKFLWPCHHSFALQEWFWLKVDSTLLWCSAVEHNKNRQAKNLIFLFVIWSAFTAWQIARWNWWLVCKFDWRWAQLLTVRGVPQPHNNLVICIMGRAETNETQSLPKSCLSPFRHVNAVAIKKILIW